MAGFLKVISAIYLIIVWLFVAVAAMLPSIGGAAGIAHGLSFILAILSGIVLSIPAAALYAFAQVVEDVRSTRNHLAAMRRYYEPGAPQQDWQ